MEWRFLTSSIWRERRKRISYFCNFLFQFGSHVLYLIWSIWYPMDPIWIDSHLERAMLSNAYFATSYEFTHLRGHCMGIKTLCIQQTRLLFWCSGWVDLKCFLVLRISALWLYFARLFGCYHLEESQSLRFDRLRFSSDFACRTYTLATLTLFLNGLEC